jgi:hypothetical protein
MFAKGISAKGSLAGFLAVLFLAMSSWSSACDLSCSLADRHLGCAAGQAAQPAKMTEADASKMDMAHCQHARSFAPDVAPGEQLAGSSSVTTAPCVHEPCRQIALSTTGERAAQRLQRGAACWTAIAVIQPTASSSLFRPKEGEGPPPKTTPLALLSTSLRI